MDSVDFDVRVGAKAGDVYPVSVTTSGGRVDGTIPPFEPQQLLIYQQARQLRFRNRLLILVSLLGVATYLTAASAVGNYLSGDVIERGIFLYLLCGVVGLGALLVFAYGEPNRRHDLGVAWCGRVAVLLGASLLGVLSAAASANLVSIFDRYFRKLQSIDSM